MCIQDIYKRFGVYFMLMAMLLVLFSMDLLVSANPELLISKIPILIVTLIGLFSKIKITKGGANDV